MWNGNSSGLWFRVATQKEHTMYPDGARAWLAGVPIEAVPRMPNDRLMSHKVAKRVNNWRSEDAVLIVPEEEDS